jgi:hypothetical protein
MHKKQRWREKLPNKWPNINEKIALENVERGLKNSEIYGK